jgi:thiol-disulfide isomerase/thioredoxin
MAADTCGPTTAPGQPAGCMITPAPGASAATPNPSASGLAAAPLTGQMLPDVAYLGVDGKSYQTAALRGAPTLLTVWAHWCGHCQAVLPKIQAWVKANANSGVVWVPIEGTKATPAQVTAFAATYKIDLPLYLDPTGGITGTLQATGYPTDRFVDAKGVIQGGSIGNFEDAAYGALLRTFPKP